MGFRGRILSVECRLQSRNQAGVVSFELAAAQVYIRHWEWLLWAWPVSALAKLPLACHLFYHWGKRLWLRATERKDKDTGKNQSSETVSTAYLGLLSIYLPLWGSFFLIYFLIYLFIFGWVDCINRKTTGKLKTYFCIFRRLYYERESLTVKLFLGIVCLFSPYLGDWEVWWDTWSGQLRPSLHLSGFSFCVCPFCLWLCFLCRIDCLWLIFVMLSLAVPV